jgi:hypothetical protein
MALLGKLSLNPFSTGFTMLPLACAPLFSDQATRRRLLQELPTLDEIGLAVRHKGDESRGVQIPGTDVAGGPSTPSAGSGPRKGKGKVATPVPSNDEVSSDDDHPCRGGGCSRAMGTPSASTHQQGSRLRKLSPCHCLAHRQRRLWRWHQGTFGAADEEAATSRAAVEREATNATVKKAADDVAMAERVAANAATEEKAATDAAVTEGHLGGSLPRRG